MTGLIQRGWVICPHCKKRQFPVGAGAVIINLIWHCKACKNGFVIDTRDTVYSSCGKYTVKN